MQLYRKQHSSIFDYKIDNNTYLGTFLVAQWLRLCDFTGGGTGLIPGRGN